MRMLATLCMLHLFLSAGAGEKAPARVPFSGKTATATLRGNGKDVQVTVTTVAYCDQVPVDAAQFWGAETEKPARTIVDLSIRVDGQPVPVWLRFSALADLADPSDISIDGGPAEFEIAIRGGSTATSYTSVLNFKFEPTVASYLLQRRRTHLNSFPKEVWEKATYSWNTLQN